jgi:hypothetical protein
MAIGIDTSYPVGVKANGAAKSFSSLRVVCSNNANIDSNTHNPANNAGVVCRFVLFISRPLNRTNASLNFVARAELSDTFPTPTATPLHTPSLPPTTDEQLPAHSLVATVPTDDPGS